ncbi:MAG TPA: phosphatase PAP2 family protein [Vicinamibacterales bacterium]|nr:phosphatase PAP2 family protein [Vicinamibacterales bacterium]
MWKAAVVAALIAAPGPAFAQQADQGSVAVRFVRDVASDYKNFFSVENAEWLGFGGAAALVMHAGDDRIFEWTRDNNPSSLSGGNEYGSQYLQIPLAIAWWGIAAAAGSDRNADAGRDLLRAQLSVVSWTYAIKFAADRTRPNGDPRSFPSGHASNSFATAMVLQEHYGWKLGVPAFLVATYTGVSRVIDNQHWASDVVFGAFLGMASGRTVTLHLRDTRVTLAPLAVPGGGGVMVSATRWST